MKMKVSEFDSFVNKFNYPIVVKKISTEGEEKIKTLVGKKKIVTYSNREIGGKMIQNADAHVSYEPIYQDKLVPIKWVEFDFINKHHEDEFSKATT